MKAIKRLLRRPAPGQGGITEDVGTAAAEMYGRLAPTGQASLKVILFIGHHKVGSTSLQDYLSRNAVALARAGILYPYVDFEGMTHMAAVATGHVQPEGSLPINVREPHNALAFRMLAEHKGQTVPGYHKRLPALGQMANAIRQQISFFEPHTVLLAAEVFANFNAVSPKLIEQLSGFFPGAEFTVVATLRRIDEYLASWQGQRLKFGHALKPLREDGVDSYGKGIHFDYRLMVEGWLKALPEARVILRDYADVRAHGGSVSDFIAQTGLEFPAGLLPERRENDSIHRGIYEIIRRANMELPQSKAVQLRRSLRELAPKLELPPSHSVELFGAENRARMLERFRPIDSWLGEVMGRDGFFDDLEAVLETDPLPELEAARAGLDLIRTRKGWCEEEAVLKFIGDLSEKGLSPNKAS
ncbi:hypothetical protein [Phaeobacter gallaeciensis]|uniref:hypothetical protein n=1 Tax=Phaeobacter gallaeciensis TaxID=60890 RepID=UPI00237F3D03|nr:hypothetical protein [Phaeobacter gallaeciensis]MDE4099390.1 hypothetical protein [Phaeobacter gallaeciensis]MDE4108199.1 hypothetical protein [Phaeobacter gallaeciensis]MDE4112649.1 hypothetical protein [Phaeobacter gallaeciensis]MDE4117106.1 hypothetical protein [Phaeobacter gallaeciensis]MDE4121563.1 hypothetical protein [Phaeobacter gallaeciensis]